MSEQLSKEVTKPEIKPIDRFFGYARYGFLGFALIMTANACFNTGRASGIAANEGISVEFDIHAGSKNPRNFLISASDPDAYPGYPTPEADEVADRYGDALWSAVQVAMGLGFAAISGSPSARRPEDVPADAPTEPAVQ